MVSEELARAWMSTASILARSQGLGTAVADEARRHELLGRSARGEWIGAIALSEPDAGSDLAGVTTRAVLDGDEWVVTGRKRWCGNAKAADFIQVLVRERDPEEGESRSKGLVNLLLEKERGEFPEGLSGYPIDKVGYHGFLTWDLTFDGVRIPKDNVIDEARAAREESDEEGEAPSRRVSPRRRSSSTPPACTPPPAPSAWPARRSRTRSCTCRSASSSATRSATSRRCGSPSPRWPRRSSRRAPSTGRSPTCSTSASPAPRRRRWSSSRPPRCRCG